MADEHVPAAEFAARCLELLDQVAHRRVSLVITRHGHPVARLVPYDREKHDAFGILAGTVTAQDDLVSGTTEQWDADT
jgi:prevent-host-death family protein